jgi:hypothetical protein
LHDGKSKAKTCVFFFPLCTLASQSSPSSSSRGESLGVRWASHIWLCFLCFWFGFPSCRWVPPSPPPSSCPPPPPPFSPCCALLRPTHDCRPRVARPPFVQSTP